jgi:hypothetical protein
MHAGDLSCTEQPEDTGLVTAIEPSSIREAKIARAIRTDILEYDFS